MTDHLSDLSTKAQLGPSKHRDSSVRPFGSRPSVLTTGPPRARLLLGWVGYRCVDWFEGMHRVGLVFLSSVGLVSELSLFSSGREKNKYTH